MMSELERINALNLEPSIPKADDGNRSSARLSQNRDMLKNEFQQFLKVMKNHDKQKAGKQGAPAAPPSTGGTSVGSGSDPAPARAGKPPNGSRPQASAPSPPFVVD